VACSGVPLQQGVVRDLIGHNTCGLHAAKPDFHSFGVSTVCMSIYHGSVAKYVGLDATLFHLAENQLRSGLISLPCHLRNCFGPTEGILFGLPGASPSMSFRLHHDQRPLLAKKYIIPQKATLRPKAWCLGAQEAVGKSVIVEKGD
ncbi:unnamed protein product, partial [Heterosigma akashiwo]